MSTDNRNDNELVPHAKYMCLSCDHSERVVGKKGEYQEVRLCPRCNGLYVDKWKLSKYKHLKNEQKVKGNLLVIELRDETAVPKVFYEGEEITGKVRISFDWETKTEELGSGGTEYNIEYADAKDGEAIKKGIGLARGKYVFKG